MRYPWHHLPEEIRLDVLQCTSGRAHLCNTGVAALEAAQKLPADQAERRSLIELGCGLLLASWEEEPFERQSAEQLRELDKAVPFLDGRLRILLARFPAAIRQPETALRSRLEKLTRLQDTEALVALTTQGRADEPGNPFWIGLARFLAFRNDRHDWFASLLAMDQSLPEPLKTACLADLAFARADWTAAAELYARALEAMPLGLWQERRGQALHQAGRSDEAVALWDALLARRPWHVSLWLRRDTVRRGLDKPGEMPSGAGVVLLYTWNGGDKIQQTLEALAASELPPFAGQAQILALDNGSSDAKTPGLLAAWQEKLGERMRVITLPVNVGAPPARNWLISEPETRMADWAVFLDDDLLVPPDWLRHFGTAMTCAPEHGVYGCQILRHDRIGLIQTADMHLLPPGVSSGPGWLPRAPVHLQASYHGENTPDFGQFAYSRPCAHVSGCCHLFRRGHLDAAGGFDLRFAPTQVDDFEHDIRMAAGGNPPYYHGPLRVRHMHATGLGTAGNLAKAMNSHANHLKLQALYPPAAFEQLRSRLGQTLLQDAVKRQR